MPLSHPVVTHFLPMNLQLMVKNEVQLFCKFFMMQSQAVPLHSFFFFLLLLPLEPPKSLQFFTVELSRETQLNHLKPHRTGENLFLCIGQF